MTDPRTVEMRLSGLFIYLMPKPRPDEEHDDFIERCISIVIDDGTAGSPEQAVAVCNSIWDDVKGASMPKDEKSNQFLFVELAIEANKPFDGVAPGDFVDMWGREVEIKASDFPKYLENTKDAIEHTRTEGGEVVGLPIDAKGHLDDEAAGWIVDASLVEVEKPNGDKLPVIQFVANWTEKGRELIEKGIRRMFSPTLNTKKKIILGGSLTNWPATRDAMGKVLLRPIALSENGMDIELDREAIPVEGTAMFGAELVEVEEETLETEDTELATFDDSAWDAGAVKSGLSVEQLRRVCLMDLNGYPGQDEPVKGLCKLPIRKTPGGAVNKNALRAAGGGARGISAVVKPSEVPQEFYASKRKAAASKIVSMWKSAFDNPAPASVYRIAGKERPKEMEGPTITIIPNQGEQDMTEELTFTQDELKEFIAEQVQAEAAKLMVQTAAGDGEEGDEPKQAPPSLMELFNLGEMTEEAQAQLKELWATEYDKLREDARRQYIEQLASINHEREMTNLSTGLVNGSEASPRGLPVQADQLQQAFMNLPKDQVPFWRDLLKAVQEKGLVEFEELGNSKQVEGQTPLPAEYAKAIRDGKMKLEDLNDPILALGDLKDYDLSEFRE